MTGSGGEALDWALALARAPGERLVLRQRPLPRGIDVLLQIAAGHGGQALSSAVSHSGETEEHLVEAVRFYLREVLFHSGADAYRVLGLERGASNDLIKSHHRWLQQWLHPDRHTSDWDAIFAGRVNAAWNHLRNADRRRAYDAAHPELPVLAQMAPLASGSARAASWMHPPPEPTARARWQGRIPLLALLAACAGLGVLALRDLARDEALVASASGAGTRDQVGRPPGEQSERLALFDRLQLPSRQTATPRARPAAPKQVASRETRRRTETSPPASSAQAVVRQMPNLARQQASAPAAAPGPDVPASPSGNLRIPPSISKIAPMAAVREAASAPVVAPPEPPSREVQPPAGQEAPPAAIAAAAQPPEQTPVVTAERVRQAQQVGDRLLAFMTRRGAKVPPIWDSLAAQNGAGQLREELLAGGSAGFSQPDWRVGGQDAQLSVDVVYPDGREGRLAAGLVWREQRWLVSRLSMERDW